MALGADTVDEEALFSSTLQSPTTMILDLTHYILRGARPAWGAILKADTSSSTLVEAMPGQLVEQPPAKRARRNSRRKPVEAKTSLIEPSLLRAIRELCEKQPHSGVLPLFSAHVPFRKKAVADAFRHAVNMPGTSPSCASPLPPQLEYASVEHDSRMLRWGNRSIAHPEVGLHKCIFAEEGTCKALQLRATNGPLDSYCTPSQYALFDSDGVVPPRQPCLLCTRDIITSVVAAQSNVVVDPSRSQQRHAPPTYSTVNQPGGYNGTFVLQPATYPILMAPFVRGDLSEISVCRTEESDPSFSGVYADQGRMVYQGPGLN